MDNDPAFVRWLTETCVYNAATSMTSFRERIKQGIRVSTRKRSDVQLRDDFLYWSWVMKPQLKQGRPVDSPSITKVQADDAIAKIRELIEDVQSWRD